LTLIISRTASRTPNDYQRCSKVGREGVTAETIDPKKECLGAPEWWLHGHAFREALRLVAIGAFDDGDVAGEELR